MGGLVDKAVGWSKEQVDEFGRAYGEMNGRRMAAEGQLRAAAANALPERLKPAVMRPQAQEPDSEALELANDLVEGARGREA